MHILVFLINPSHSCIVLELGSLVRMQRWGLWPS